MIAASSWSLQEVRVRRGRPRRRLRPGEPLAVGAGTLRGLHLQRAPKAQAKLTRVIDGEIFDVAADIRPDSPTYGMWVGALLSSDNRSSIFIPAGYAHGFCVVSAEAQVVYKTTEKMRPSWSGECVGRSAAGDSLAVRRAAPVGARSALAEPGERVKPVNEIVMSSAA